MVDDMAMAELLDRVVIVAITACQDVKRHQGDEGCDSSQDRSRFIGRAQPVTRAPTANPVQA
jgi:hypothetical protein